jgi:hypothetical protein
LKNGIQAPPLEIELVLYRVFRLMLRRHSPAPQLKARYV